MIRHQRTISTLVFFALLLAALPSAALANSLLSGYGGPGEGNQALLGSALLNSPKGGGGGGASTGSASSQSSSGAGEATTQQADGATGAGKPSTRGRPAKRTRAGKQAARSGAAGASSRAAVIYPAASREVTTGGSRALGLSGADFVYIILALGVLAVTAFLTVRLARTTVTRGPDRRPG
jgi:hypothetical protein